MKRQEEKLEGDPGGRCSVWTMIKIKEQDVIYDFIIFPLCGKCESI